MIIVACICLLREQFLCYFDIVLAILNVVTLWRGLSENSKSCVCGLVVAHSFVKSSLRANEKGEEYLRSFDK